MAKQLAANRPIAISGRDQVFKNLARGSFEKLTRDFGAPATRLRLSAILFLVSPLLKATGARRCPRTTVPGQVDAVQTRRATPALLAESAFREGRAGLSASEIRGYEDDRFHLVTFDLVTEGASVERLGLRGGLIVNTEADTAPPS
jgi:hypothetical protein